jgi:hypothetical protein
MSTPADRIAFVESSNNAGRWPQLSARTRSLVCIVAVYAAVVLCPRAPSVTAAGWRQFGVFVATLAGLILQPLPAAAMVLIGVIAAIVVGGLGVDRALSGFGEPSEWLLLGAMLGYHLFPYVPTIDLHKYWRSVRPLIFAPSLSPLILLKYVALWLTTCCLIGGHNRVQALSVVLAGVRHFCIRRQDSDREPCVFAARGGRCRYGGCAVVRDRP